MLEHNLNNQNLGIERSSNIIQRKNASNFEIISIIFWIYYLFIFSIYGFRHLNETYINRTYINIYQTVKRILSKINTIFYLINSILFILFLFNIIISLILGFKNADTKNGASPYKCVISYITLGSIYKDHRIKE